MSDNGRTRPTILTEGLTRVYRMGDEEVHALRGVNLKVMPGEFIALMGTSGSGKSTLMQLLGCLDTPTGGSYWLEGTDVSRLALDERAQVRNRRIGFIFQTFNLLPRLTALDNVMLPLLYRGRVDQKAARLRSLAALKSVGLAHRVGHRPMELSGGQRQRVAIARALVADPAILLADEPTGNVDSTTAEEIMRLLIALHHAGRTIILVTHDAQVASHAERIIHMRDGQIVKEEAAYVAG
jgi:putative ABC transport system ATP-binding protein